MMILSNYVINGREFRLEKPSLEYYFDTGLVSSISDILSDDNGRLWIAYPTKGIMSYYPQIDEKRYFCTANGLSSDFVRALEKDDNGIVWAATANNISLIEPVSGSIEILESDNHKPETISSTSIKAIHKAKDGTMWVGSYYGGLDYYDKNAFQSNTLVIPEYHNTHTERVIRSLSTDPDGSIWVGTSRTGIFRYYPSYDKFESFDKLPAGENVLNAVAYHKNGQEVILACEGTGLNVYDKHRNKIIWKGKIPRVFCLAAYDSSRYLVGTMRGLYLFDIEIKQITRVLTKGEKGRVYYVFVDSENDIWIGYDDHLTKGRLVQNGSDDFVFQNEIRRLDIPQVQDIEELNNNLYFASRAGLFKYDRGSDIWNHLNSEKGIHTNLIRGIEIDSYENIWVSTDRSVLSVNPHNLDFREYSVRDGFSNEKYNTYCHCKTSDGTIWFGGIPNICYFKPRGNVLDRLPERPGILGVSINGIPVHGIDRVPRIRSLNNSLVFKLALPKRYSKDKVFYCLEGYDKGWNLLGENDSSVSYSNLPDGEYHLKVKAVNLGGLEALYESGIIRILKPWYNRWWMVAIFALILVSSQILLLLNQKKKSEQAIDFIKSDMSKDIKKARVASYMTIKSLNRERDLEFMEKALEVVNENLSNENFGIDQFAKAMEMSRSNLNIRMKNVYGVPALSLIKRIRIEKAIEYLNKGEKNISEIAYSTGFSSATYFATVFKQITGISPTSWKNKTMN